MGIGKDLEYSYKEHQKHRECREWEERDRYEREKAKGEEFINPHTHRISLGTVRIAPPPPSFGHSKITGSYNEDMARQIGDLKEEVKKLKAFNIKVVEILREIQSDLETEEVQKELRERSTAVWRSVTMGAGEYGIDE